jgi:phosphatidylglycerol---prolipoprotein diacylglyceryl transferase
MKPQIFGLETYFLFWPVAAVFGIWTGMRLARRAGFSPRTAFLALVALAFTIFFGSKLLYISEYFLFPLDDPVPVGQTSLIAVLWHGFRIPGGILLLIPVMPLLCRRLRLPTLRFADAVIPAVGIAIVFIRTGCLCNGCCFGRVTNFPLAITFPRGARVYEWQMLHGLIGGPATHTLPVHPLQIYFGLLGLLLYVLGRRWQQTKSFEGEVWVNFNLVFFGGTFLLELLRPTFLHQNLLVTVAAACAALIIKVWARQEVPVVAAAHS